MSALMVRLPDGRKVLAKCAPPPEPPKKRKAGKKEAPDGQ